MPTRLSVTCAIVLLGIVREHHWSYKYLYNNNNYVSDQF